MGDDYYTKYNHLDIITEDRAIVNFGDKAYNYYDMKPGTIGRIHAPYNDGADKNQDIWFDFVHDDGSQTSMLNGQRICTRAFAARRGFPNPGT
jgi:hypothetical protein